MSSVIKCIALVSYLVPARLKLDACVIYRAQIPSVLSVTGRLSPDQLCDHPREASVRSLRPLRGAAGIAFTKYASTSLYNHIRFTTPSFSPM